MKTSRAWRVLFSAGMVLTSLCASLTTGQADTPNTPMRRINILGFGSGDMKAGVKSTQDLLPETVCWQSDQGDAGSHRVHFVVYKMEEGSLDIVENADFKADPAQCNGKDSFNVTIVPAAGKKREDVKGVYLLVGIYKDTETPQLLDKAAGVMMFEVKQ